MAQGKSRWKWVELDVVDDATDMKKWCCSPCSHLGKVRHLIQKWALFVFSKMGV
jgi:hypothetical protein